MISVFAIIIAFAIIAGVLGWVALATQREVNGRLMAQVAHLTDEVDCAKTALRVQMGATDVIYNSARSVLSEYGQEAVEKFENLIAEGGDE